MRSCQNAETNHHLAPFCIHVANLVYRFRTLAAKKWIGAKQTGFRNGSITGIMRVKKQYRYRNTMLFPNLKQEEEQDYAAMVHNAALP
jgi:hypothetical protein